MPTHPFSHASDILATDGCSGGRKYPTEVGPRDCPEGVCHHNGGAVEHDALKTSTPVASTYKLLAKEVEQLRQEKTTLEQVLQEEKSKQPVQISIPDTSDMDTCLV
jgi:hypothetical protein